MPQGLSAGPQRPTRPGPGGRPAQRRLAACLSTDKRASTKLPAQRGHFSQPGTAPLELSSTANGWWQQNQDRRAASATTNAPVASSMQFHDSPRTGHSARAEVLRPAPSGTRPAAV